MAKALLREEQKAKKNTKMQLKSKREALLEKLR